MEEEVRKGGKTYVFRYRPDNEFTLDEIENSYIYFSDRESLNDPFDSSPDLIKFMSGKSDIKASYQFLREQIPSEELKLYFEEKFSPEYLTSLISESIPKYLSEFGIACFSIIPYINMPLWANYANNHKGVCLQYNTENDKDFFDGLSLIKYVEKLNQIEFNIAENQHRIMDVFYLKDKNWNYEKELRLIKKEKGKIKFKKNALRNIICGYKSDDKYIDKLITICKKRELEIGVYKMLKPEKQNNVSFIRMN